MNHSRWKLTSGLDDSGLDETKPCETALDVLGLPEQYLGKNGLAMTNITGHDAEFVIWGGVTSRCDDTQRTTKGFWPDSDLLSVTLSVGTLRGSCPAFALKAEARTWL